MALKKLVVPDSGSLIPGGQATPEMMAAFNGMAGFTGSVKTLLEGTIVDSRDWEMRFVEDGTYSLALKTPFEMTISEVTTDCDSGTCSAKLQIDGVDLGGKDT